MTGVNVPMVTPMTETGEVDLGSLERLTEHLISRGVSGLYPCGTTGEVNNLTPEERKAIYKTVVETASGRVNVFCQIGGEVTSVSADLAKYAYEIGADGIGLLTPTYYPLSDEELLAYLETVVRSVPEDFPVYLYGIPFMAVNRLSKSLVQELNRRCPNVIGIKYSVGDILTLMDFHRINNSTFDVLVAPVQMFLPALAVGICGTVSGNCNIIPEDLNELIRLWEERKIDEARVLQDRIAAVAAMTGVKEAAKCKALLKRIGVIDSDAVRLPQTGLTEAEKEELFRFFEENYPAYDYRR